MPFFRDANERSKNINVEKNDLLIKNLRKRLIITLYFITKDIKKSFNNKTI